MWVVQRAVSFSFGIFQRACGQAPCPKAWIKLGWWVERWVPKARDSVRAVVMRPRLERGFKKNKASLISEAGWIHGRQLSTAWLTGIKAGLGIYVTSRLVNPITGMATAWGSPMETGLCLIQTEWTEKTQASFNSHLILTQTVLWAYVICITGKKGLCFLGGVCVCVCECVSVSVREREREQEKEGKHEQCCKQKCIVGLHMHMLRDKRSHTDQKIKRDSVATHSCILLSTRHFYTAWHSFISLLLDLHINANPLYPIINVKFNENNPLHSH